MLLRNFSKQMLSAQQKHTLRMRITRMFSMTTIFVEIQYFFTYLER